MRKIWLIAKREYTYNFRRKSYLFSAFGVPVVILILVGVLILIMQQQFTATGTLGTIGYVDKAGVLEPGVALPDEYLEFESEEEAANALESGTIGAYFVIPRSYWRSGIVEAYAYGDVPEGIQDQLESVLRANIAAAINSPYVERLQEPLNFIFRTIDGSRSVDLDTAIALFIVPYVMAFAVLMAISITSTFLMQGVMEDKENRVIELIVTSVSPLELLWGKMIGMAALSLTQLLIWLGAAVAAVELIGRGGHPVIAQALRLPPDYAITMIIFSLLGFLLYASLMIGIGASIPTDQEARQIASLILMPFVLPFFFMIQIMGEPSGPIALALTLVPFTSPLTIAMRWPLTTIPLWQLLTGMALLLVTMAIIIWIGARIFRASMLMYGKRLNLRELWRAIRYSTVTG